MARAGKSIENAVSNPTQDFACAIQSSGKPALEPAVLGRVAEDFRRRGEPGLEGGGQKRLPAAGQRLGQPALVAEGAGPIENPALEGVR